MGGRNLRPDHSAGKNDGSSESRCAASWLRATCPAMGKRDPRVDAYIAKKAEFARPILEFLRELVHQAGPQLDETIKWGMPTFEYKGQVAGMAAFKSHCAFWFAKGPLVVRGSGPAGKQAMGEFGRITNRRDLPARKVLVGYVKRAIRLNEEGVKSPTRSKDRPAKKPLRVPADFAAALTKHRRARETFAGFPPGARREYVEWITEAKRDATRASRIEQAIAWMAEGKPRNWKYQAKR